MKKSISILLSIVLLLSTFGMLGVSADTPTHDVFDFESDTPESLQTKFHYMKMAAWPYTVDVETTAPIAGTKSMKLQYQNAGSVTASNRSAIRLGLYDTSKTYRISGKYKVVSGALGALFAVNVGLSASENASDANIWGGIAAPRKATFVDAATEPGEMTTFSGIVSPQKGDGNIYLAVKPTKSAPAGTTVLLDDITVAEVLDVKADSSDATMGTATVANAADSADTKIAVGEQATFTATATEGYKFTHWKNAAGKKVSTEAVYTCTVSDAMTLTACFTKKLTYEVFDFESDTPESLQTKFHYMKMAAWPYTVDVEATAPIAGTKSMKLQYQNAGSVTASNRSAIRLGLYDTSKTYRISGKYKVVSGALGALFAVNVGLSASENASDANIWGNIAAPRKATFVDAATEPGEMTTFSGIVSPQKGDGNIYLAVKPTKSAPAGTTVLLDDITIAEVADVTAASADEAQGKVTVTNATDATYTNFAMGEQATFTATAEDGYKFHHWENAAGETVSAEATYTCTITDPMALTAYFAASDASDVFDFENDTPESLQTKFHYMKMAAWPYTVDVEATAPIAGTKSMKLQYQNAGSVTASNRSGIRLGLYDTSKTYYISGKYKVVSGALGALFAVNVGLSASENATDAQLWATIAAPRKASFVNAATEPGDTQTFSGLISPQKGDGNIYLAVKPTKSAPAGTTVLLDDITIIEVPKVEAAVNNSAAGAVTVTNDTDETRTYFMPGDRATFKATANEGYTFSHWEKGGQKISENATYSCTIMSDTALVAHFTANEAPPPSAVDGAYTIDFETPATGSEAAFEMNTIMEIVSAKGADGQDSRVLHVKPGDHKTDLGSAAQINPTAIKTDADETFSVEVRPVYEYELSFWAKIDSNATYDTTWAKFDVRNGNTAIADSGVTFHDATRGEWKQYKATFTVPAGVEKVSIYANFGSKTPDIYVDNIVLTEKGFNPGTVTEFHSAVDGSYTIDFDTAETGLNTVFQLPNIMSVVDGEAYNEKNSKMLKVKEGNHSVESNTPAHLNAESTKFKKFDSDPVFTLKVREGYVYKFSFRAKIDAPKNSANDTTWSKFYITNNGTDIGNGVQFHTAPRGEWNYYVSSFTVPAGVDKVSIYANFGSKTPDIYVDDITVTELGKTFAGWNGPQKEYVINFDDFAVSLTGVGQEITDAPARDGKVSRAIRIIPGSYSSATALNWDTTVNSAAGKTNTDPVFSLPVKENTFYRFSCWIYIPEKQGGFAWHGMYPIYGEATKNMYNLDDKGVGEWVKLETSFITKAGQNVFSYYYNFGSNPKEIFIDDITYVEVPAGTLDGTTATYTSELYNLLDAKALDELIASKKSGAIKVPVAKFSPHTFGITAKGSAKTSISLSLDGTTPLGKSFDTSVDGTIKPTSKEKRYGYEFVTDSSGYIYVIFNNPDGSLEVSDAQIFLSNSRSGGRPMGFEANPNVDPVIGLVEEDASLYGTFTIAGPDAKADTTIDSDLDGDTTAGGTGSVDTDSTSPKTGDKGIALVLLMVSMLSACLVIVSFRKGKVN